MNPILSPRVRNRLFWVFVLSTLFSIVFLGYAFFLINMGFIRLVLLLAVYWQPFYNVLVKTLNIQEAGFVKIKMSWLEILTVSLRAGLILLLFYLGLKILLDQGFLNQNLIYMMIKL